MFFFALFFLLLSFCPYIKKEAKACVADCWESACALCVNGASGDLRRSAAGCKKLSCASCVPRSCSAPEVRRSGYAKLRCVKNVQDLEAGFCRLYCLRPVMGLAVYRATVFYGGFVGAARLALSQCKTCLAPKVIGSPLSPIAAARSWRRLQRAGEMRRRGCAAFRHVVFLYF